MNRYRVTVEAWTLVDVDVEAHDRVQAQDVAFENMAFPPVRGWNSLDFDFKLVDVEPDQDGHQTDLLEMTGEPWGVYDPDFDAMDQVRAFAERYGRGPHEWHIGNQDRLSAVKDLVAMGWMIELAAKVCGVSVEDAQAHVWPSTNDQEEPEEDQGA